MLLIITHSSMLDLECEGNDTIFCQNFSYIKISVPLRIAKYLVLKNYPSLTVAILEPIELEYFKIS